MTIEDDADRRAIIEEIYPELTEIVDDDLRERVIQVWVTAMAENPNADPRTMPWGAYHDDIHDELQLDHVRQVTQHAIAIADTMLRHRPGLDLDRDAVVAAGLLHDVSKLYEMTGNGKEFSEIGKLIPHPIMVNYLFHKHELPVTLQRIVLAHTHQTAVQPRSIEGQIIKLADILALEALSWEHRRRPHNLIETSHYPRS